MNHYDVIIIGGGAAGLSAAIYSARREMKTLVLTVNLGGQAALASEIENYPGVKISSGVKLMKKFSQQAKKFGAEIVFEKIEKIKKSGKEFEVKGAKNNYQAKTIILALGRTPRRLNIPGEGNYHGKGVAYCATCDAPLFKDKIVAVVGGGNSAFDAAILLTKIAKQVYLIHRREEFRAEEYRVRKFKKTKNGKLLLNSEIKELKGDNFLKSAVIINNQTNKKSEIKIEGLFIEIGYEIDSTLFKNLVEIDKLNQIKINACGRTSTPGIFAAGDVADIPYKQIIISAGAGAKAALSAYDYLHNN